MSILRRLFPRPNTKPTTHTPQWITVKGKPVDIALLSMPQRQALLAELEQYSIELQTQLTENEDERRQKQLENTILANKMFALQVTTSQLEAEAEHLGWVVSLRQRFGDELAACLISQELTVGMTTEHLFACFGEPDSHSATSGGKSFSYGKPGRGAYFEATTEGVLTKVEVITAPLPPTHLFKLDY